MVWPRSACARVRAGVGGSRLRALGVGACVGVGACARARARERVRTRDYLLQRQRRGAPLSQHRRVTPPRVGAHADEQADAGLPSAAGELLAVAVEHLERALLRRGQGLRACLLGGQVVVHEHMRARQQRRQHLGRPVARVAEGLLVRVPTLDHRRARGPVPGDHALHHLVGTEGGVPLCRARRHPRHMGAGDGLVERSAAALHSATSALVVALHRGRQLGGAYSAEVGREHPLEPQHFLGVRQVGRPDELEHRVRLAAEQPFRRPSFFRGRRLRFPTGRALRCLLWDLIVVHVRVHGAWLGRS